VIILSLITYSWYIPVPELILYKDNLREVFYNLFYFDRIETSVNNSRPFLKSIGYLKKHSKLFHPFSVSLISVSIQRRFPTDLMLMHLYSAKKRIIINVKTKTLNTVLKVNIYPMGLISISVTLPAEMSSKDVLNQWKKATVSGIPLLSMITKYKKSIIESLFTSSGQIIVKKRLNTPKILVEIDTNKFSEKQAIKWIDNIFVIEKTNKMSFLGKYKNDLIIFTPSGGVIFVPELKGRIKQNQRKQLRFNLQILFDWSFGLYEYLLDAVICHEKKINFSRDQLLASETEEQYLIFYYSFMFSCNPSVLSFGTQPRILPSCALRTGHRNILEKINYPSLYETLSDKLIDSIIHLPVSVWAKILIDLYRVDLGSLKQQLNQRLKKDLDFNYLLSMQKIKISSEENDVLDYLIYQYIEHVVSYLKHDAQIKKSFSLTKSAIGRGINYSGKYIQEKLPLILIKLDAKQLTVSKPYEGPGRSTSSRGYSLNFSNPYIRELSRKAFLESTEVNAICAMYGVSLPIIPMQQSD